MKSNLNDTFKRFQENVIETNKIFAGMATGGETGAGPCESGFVDSAGDPNTFIETETQCTIDPDKCDALARSISALER
ncbi:hypothetical protein [Fluviicola taffensis]|uniref:Uncharacterized protein n=1 Tax=Fluviicola taffensis (strain DSM 16823 / NCIMB 13979 / RW262) TaxID=755732 RepID=F2IBL3_FLUTR|nr:hypothetical protein [Fluviicola taffensis]AEA45339.1 hypothetical protein Fluta_3367 [Fluviicola taffensis DSM 16823]